jgi:hypothetical protein
MELKCGIKGVRLDLFLTGGIELTKSRNDVLQPKPVSVSLNRLG